ncbi:MFS transporter [Micromonospora krabiensis]|uniref:Predicted arabinose efflux permease, MFS family n=1 Tax=Micromonospora krabiensis TaxID=307121 RepID=A0A1C3N7C2_9ACTN|nr:Predicted arabinose efflux permease, MFS family [Micromonospora krabiensis]
MSADPGATPLAVSATPPTGTPPAPAEPGPPTTPHPPRGPADPSPTTPRGPASPDRTDAPADGVAIDETAGADVGHRRLPRLLRERTFRRYWSAQTVSYFGDEVSTLALPLLAVLVTDAGPAQMGYLTAALLAPNLFFSLLAGAWVDRLPHKRRIMILSDLGRAVLLATIPAAYLLDLLTLTQLYTVAFAMGTLAVLFEVARGPLFVSVVRRQDYVEANTLLNGSRAMSFVAGPSIGGLLVQLLSAPIALVTDALSYVWSAYFLGRIRPTEPPPARGRGLGIAEGLRFIVRTPMMRATVLGTTTLNLFNFMFSALFVLYATRDLHLSPGLLGAVLGAGAIGGLFGAAITGRLTRRLGIGPTMVAGFVLFPAPLLLVPLAGGPKPVVLGMLFAAEFLCAVGVMLLDIVTNSVQTALTPGSLLARTSGVRRTINYGIRPIGALAGGALGAAIGVREALWIATAGALTGALWVFFSPARRLRDLPEAADG